MKNQTFNTIALLGTVLIGLTHAQNISQVPSDIVADKQVRDSVKTQATSALVPQKKRIIDAEVALRFSRDTESPYDLTYFGLDLRGSLKTDSLAKLTYIFQYSPEGFLSTQKLETSSGQYSLTGSANRVRGGMHYDFLQQPNFTLGLLGGIGLNTLKTTQQFDGVFSESQETVQQSIGLDLFLGLQNQFMFGRNLIRTRMFHEQSLLGLHMIVDNENSEGEAAFAHLYLREAEVKYEFATNELLKNWVYLSLMYRQLGLKAEFDNFEIIPRYTAESWIKPKEYSEFFVVKNMHVGMGVRFGL